MRMSICLPTEDSFSEVERFLDHMRPMANVCSYEIIIANCGDADLSDLAKIHDNLRIFHHKETKARARVRAVYEATGELVLIANTKDIINVAGLQKALTWFDNNSNGAAYFSPTGIIGAHYDMPIINAEKHIPKNKVDMLVGMLLEKSYLHNVSVMKTSLIQKVYLGKEHFNQTIAFSYALNFLGDIYFSSTCIFEQTLENNLAYEFCLKGTEKTRTTGEWLATRIFTLLSNGLISDEIIAQLKEMVFLLYKQALQVSVYCGLRYPIPKEQRLYQKIYNHAQIAFFLMGVLPKLNVNEDQAFLSFLNENIPDLHDKVIAELICLRFSQIGEVKGIQLYGINQEFSQKIISNIKSMSDYKVEKVSSIDALRPDWLTVFRDESSHDKCVREREDIHPGFCAIIDVLEKVLALKNHLLNTHNNSEHAA